MTGARERFPKTFVLPYSTALRKHSSESAESCMSSNGNGLGNGKNGKKRRRRIIWAAIVIVVLGAGGYGVKAALSPSRTIDPSKLASVERGDLARVVVATGKIQPLSKVEVNSKASGKIGRASCREKQKSG